MRAVAALFISLALHGLLAAALGLALVGFSSSDRLPQLDLTSVELSLAEKVDEQASVQPRPNLPAMKAEPKPPREKTPEVAKLKTPPPPDSTEPKLREPAEPHPPHLETPPAPAQPVAAPEQAKVEAPPRPRRAIKPDYPRGSRQRGEEGDVVVSLTVSADGRAEAVAIATSSGFPELDQAAIKAAEKARFTPAKSGDRSVAAQVKLRLSFRLTDR